MKDVWQFASIGIFENRNQHHAVKGPSIFMQYVNDGFLRGKGHRKLVVDNYLVFYLVY